MADTAPILPSAQRPSVDLPIRRCLGVTLSPSRDEADRVGVVLQKADGGLHILTMDYPTALAIALAIRADIRFPGSDPTWP